MACRGLVLVLGLVLMFCASAAPIQAQGPDPYLDFASHLFKQGDYYRAITEAKRFLFLKPGDPRRAQAYLLIARAYMESGQFAEARAAFLPVVSQRDRPDLAAEAVLDLGLCLERLGQPEDALSYYRGLLTEPSLPPNRAADIHNVARYRLGRLLLKAGRWSEARRVLETVEEGHGLKESAQVLARRAPEGAFLPHRSPATAGLLSAILPGAGQIYVNRPTDAGLAFTLNTAFLWGTVEAYNDENWAVFALLGLMEIGWYGGNIYNAVNGAHIYNREAKTNFLKRLEREHGWRLGYAPRSPGLVLSWSVKY